MEENESIITKLANNDTLKILAILGVTGGTGTAGTFAYQSAHTLDNLYATTMAMNEELKELREDQIQVNSLLQNGFAPRIKTLEAEMQNVRDDIRTRTADRFNRSDGRELKADLEKRLERIEKEILYLRKAYANFKDNDK